MAATKTEKLVRVVYWAGSTQREAEVSSYKEAMDLIGQKHRNAHDPAFYEISTGQRIFDDGNGLCAEDRSYYVV